MIAALILLLAVLGIAFMREVIDAGDDDDGNEVTPADIIAAIALVAGGVALIIWAVSHLIAN